MPKKWKSKWGVRRVTERLPPQLEVIEEGALLDDLGEVEGDLGTEAWSTFGWGLVTRSGQRGLFDGAHGKGDARLEHLSLGVEPSPTRDLSSKKRGLLPGHDPALALRPHSYCAQTKCHYRK
jgi:hypothetical protein